MSMAVLLDKLTEIELSIGVETDATLRDMVLEAQDTALALQKSMAEHLRRESRRGFPETHSSSRYAA